jgi:hypothetical protein
VSTLPSFFPILSGVTHPDGSGSLDSDEGADLHDVAALFAFHGLMVGASPGRAAEMLELAAKAAWNCADAFVAARRGPHRERPQPTADVSELARLRSLVQSIHARLDAAGVTPSDNIEERLADVLDNVDLAVADTRFTPAPETEGGAS